MRTADACLLRVLDYAYLIKERDESEQCEREKPLIFKRHNVVRFLLYPKKKKVNIEVNKIMNQVLYVKE